MKKIFVVLIIMAIFLIAFITMNFKQTINESDSNQKNSNIAQNQSDTTTDEETWNPDAAPEQVAKVEGATTTFPVDNNSSEKEIMDTMHFMTHQKVMAEKKVGAVEMNKENIEKLYLIVQKSEFKRKKYLLQIATKWKNQDFSNIIEDHNYFWKLDGGKVGEAYRVLKASDEERFIKNNFRSS
ncbi:DUF6241 domain-containing protein [Metabacillus sp. GX 13764]|uniref:DUF6241 domain-containing protein n=1 Tax=Metabacillus kandeliae TaxID=2900151 RepID=UPI001E2834AB|nr:DUF6241 domain-containing protein [Metabacillus kandeliae]MCD7035365.1 DUF6241 domain-containing protein [Metabacillus kandeliae]